MPQYASRNCLIGNGLTKAARDTHQGPHLKKWFTHTLLLKHIYSLPVISTLGIQKASNINYNYYVILNLIIYRYNVQIYLQFNVCRLCNILEQVLAHKRTRSGLENKNSNLFSKHSESKFGSKLIACAKRASLKSSYTLQFKITCFSFSRTLQNGHKRDSSAKPS